METAMAADLEMKMKNLVEGYEQLDMISSKLPSSILHMASKHSKNLLGEVDILTPKDHEDFVKQQEMLGKVRQDLQGMAYERVVIDVLTRDAILNAKRKNRALNKPPPSRFGKSPGSPKEAMDDIDSPIPINPYPNAAQPPLDKYGNPRTGNKGGNNARQQGHASATQMQIGTLPAAIQGLRTLPDNTTKYRRGKGTPKVSSNSKKYRHLNEPTKVPRVDKRTVDPETLITYALASKKQEATETAMRKLLSMQGNQAQEMAEMRELMKQIAERDQQDMNRRDCPRPLSSPHEARYIDEDDDASSFSSDIIEDLSKYKVISVSKTGFKSGPICTNKTSVEAIPEAKEVSGERPEPVSPARKDSDPAKETEGDVEFELVIDPAGESGWLPKPVHKIPDTQHMQVPAPYANPFGGSVTSGQSLNRPYIEDGHTYDKYINMNDSCESAEGLIVVAGKQSTLGARNMILPYMPTGLHAPMSVSAKPPPNDGEAVQLVNRAADTTTTGMDFPRGYTYASKVLPLDTKDNVEVSEDEIVCQDSDKQEDYSIHTNEEEPEVKQSPADDNNDKKVEEKIGVDQNLMSLLHQLVHTQQSTMQGHNELILALLNQQNKPASVPPAQVEFKQNSEMEAVVQLDSESSVESVTALAEEVVEKPLVDLNMESEIQADKSEEITSATSFGLLLKKGANAYSQSPSQVTDQTSMKHKQRVIPKRILESEVLPFYNTLDANGMNGSRPPPPIATTMHVDTVNPTQVIAGVLVEALQQLSNAPGTVKPLSHVLPPNTSIDARNVPPSSENKYLSDRGKDRDYFLEEPSEQRGQQRAPISAWAKPLPSAWVNVSVPPSTSDRARMRSSNPVSSIGSWDEDFHSADSDVEDDYGTHEMKPRGILLVDSHDNVVEREDPTLAMLRRDMADSHQHRAAIAKHRNIDVNDFDADESDDASWDVEGHAMYSSDESLGSYRSLGASGRRPNVSGNGESDHHHKTLSSWSKSPKDGTRSRKPSSTYNNNDLDHSIELPVPLCSNILPCAATLHYANAQLPRNQYTQKPSRHPHTVEEEFPNRDPNNRILRLAPRKQTINVDDDVLSLSTYSSGDSDQHIPSFRQADRPTYRPTRSDYEPTTPSSSTVSSLGSMYFPRPTSSLRSKVEIPLSSESKGEGLRMCKYLSDGQSSSLDSDDSPDADYAHFVLESSSLDESSSFGSIEKGSVSSNSCDSSGSDSLGTYTSGYTSSSSRFSSDNVDLELPRSKLRLWRPPASHASKNSTK